MRILGALALAIGTGTLVYFIVLVAAWVGLGPEPMLYQRQWITQIHIRNFCKILNEDLEKHKGEHQQGPHHVTDLPIFSSDEIPPSYPRNAVGEFLDEWMNPVQIVMTGEKIVVVSLGRDGVAGGIGPDADLYSDRRPNPSKFPSLQQFLNERDRWEIKNGGPYLDAIFTGVVVACTVFVTLFRQSMRRENENLRTAAVRLVIVVGLTLATGIVLLLFHIPNGH